MLEQCNPAIIDLTPRTKLSTIPDNCFEVEMPDWIENCGSVYLRSLTMVNSNKFNSAVIKCYLLERAKLEYPGYYLKECKSDLTIVLSPSKDLIIELATLDIPGFVYQGKWGQFLSILPAWLPEDYLLSQCLDNIQSKKLSLPFKLVNLLIFFAIQSPCMIAFEILEIVLKVLLPNKPRKRIDSKSQKTIYQTLEDSN